jgi:hypothetical protein
LEPDEELPLLFAGDDLPLDDLLPPVFEEDLDLEFEPPDDVRFDVDEDERPPPLFAREPELDFDEAVLPPPEELELLRPLPLVFLLVDFLAVEDPLAEPLLRPPLVLDLELELFDVDDDLRLAVDLDPLARSPPDDARERLAGTIVSAAAPTALTAAPVAAPAKISPAMSITLLTIFDVVDRVDREEPLFDLFAFFFDEEVEDDAFAIIFLPMLFAYKDRLSCNFKLA